MIAAGSVILEGTLVIFDIESKMHDKIETWLILCGGVYPRLQSWEGDIAPISNLGRTVAIFLHVVWYCDDIFTLSLLLSALSTN